MSEIRLNLTDARHILNGTIHGSIADACVAALSAEPETISELDAALARFIKPLDDSRPFALFHKSSEINSRPWDAGIVIIDLAARVVASESTYSQLGPEGEVHYHDGVCATDISVLYRLPDDWIFLNSIDEYECLRKRRRQERAATPPLDARQVLYGRPLLEWIASERVGQPSCSNAAISPAVDAAIAGASPALADPDDALRNEISALHARWLTIPRNDLRGKSPRDVFLARQEFIDFDLHTRSLQWGLQREGPPCLATDSFAYRFAGFGTHEWVVYYDLVRYLLWCAATLRRLSDGDSPAQPNADEVEAMISRLEEFKTEWLEQAHPDYDGRIPALIIDNERRRLPIAMLGRDMVIDEDCPMCQMIGAETGFGLEVGFWGLDGSSMDDDFAFTSFRTVEEWEADRRHWKEFSENFNREWKERKENE